MTEVREEERCARSWHCMRGKHALGPCSVLKHPVFWKTSTKADFFGCSGDVLCAGDHAVANWEAMSWLRSGRGQVWLATEEGANWLGFHPAAQWGYCHLCESRGHVASACPLRVAVDALITTEVYPEGKCYLDLVKPQYADEAAQVLGMWPSMVGLLDAPAIWFSADRLRSRSFVVAGRVCHVAALAGRCVGDQLAELQVRVDIAKMGTLGEYVYMRCVSAGVLEVLDCDSIVGGRKFSKQGSGRFMETVRTAQTVVPSTIVRMPAFDAGHCWEALILPEYRGEVDLGSWPTVRQLLDLPHRVISSEAYLRELMFDRVARDNCHISLDGQFYLWDDLIGLVRDVACYPNTFGELLKVRALDCPGFTSHGLREIDHIGGNVRARMVFHPSIAADALTAWRCGPLISRDTADYQAVRRVDTMGDVKVGVDSGDVYTSPPDWLVYLTGTSLTDFDPYKLFVMSCQDFDPKDYEYRETLQRVGKAALELVIATVIAELPEFPKYTSTELRERLFSRQRTDDMLGNCPLSVLQRWGFALGTDEFIYSVMGLIYLEVGIAGVRFACERLKVDFPGG